MYMYVCMYIYVYIHTYIYIITTSWKVLLPISILLVLINKTCHCLIYWSCWQIPWYFGWAMKAYPFLGIVIYFSHLDSFMYNLPPHFLWSFKSSLNLLLQLIKHSSFYFKMGATLFWGWENAFPLLFFFLLHTL